jgi:GGDEF domain-containing protein
VTRMRSHAETGQMVGAVFKSFRDKPQPMGIVVLTIANLYALEQLHGAPAVNHALFVCAARLKRTVPGEVEMGRLGNDGFVLVMPNCKESAMLIDLARAVEARLRRSVSLSTSRDAARLETDNTLWVADIGVGVLMVSNPESRGADAIAMGRRMSRTAISYVSRIAWFDHSSGETVELPDNRLL